MATGTILKVLEGFHHWSDQRIAGIADRSTEYREWEYHLVADVLDAAGIWLIKEYIKIWQDNIKAQVA